MPYIRQEDRKLYDLEIKNLVNKLINIFSSEPTKIHKNRAGHMNYIMTKLIYEFYTELQKKLLGTEQLNYSDFNEIIGFLECCKQEVYRRAVAPYEDSKIKSNGDVT